MGMFEIELAYILNNMQYTPYVILYLKRNSLEHNMLP